MVLNAIATAKEKRDLRRVSALGSEDKLGQGRSVLQAGMSFDRRGRVNSAELVAANLILPTNYNSPHEMFPVMPR